MVISQKALVVVQHCGLSYVGEHIGRCFVCLILNVSRIDVAQRNVFLLQENFTALVQGHIHDVVTLGI